MYHILMSVFGIFICLPQLVIHLWSLTSKVRDAIDEQTCSQELVARRTGLNSLPPPVLNLWGFTMQLHIICDYVE